VSEEDRGGAGLHRAPAGPAPKVSVLMNVFNGVAYVRDAITSILTQTFPDFELIVVDDGSTDGTSQVLSTIHDPRLRVVRQANRGIAPTCAAHLPLCRGEYVARMDADDLARVDRLQRQVGFLDEHPEHTLCGSSLLIIDELARVVGRREYPVEDDAVRAVLLDFNPFAQSAVMFRREAALTAGGYDSAAHYVEDYDLWLRMARRGRVHNLPEPLVAYRLHGEASKVKGTKRQLRATLELKNKAFVEYGYDPSLRNWFTYLAQFLMLQVLPATWIYGLFRRSFLKPLASATLEEAWRKGVGIRSN
jgi:glycosyltransferase involved in cell wall biosynthesis